ncbi:hypothetical protein GW891_00275 [bacterium]|nr:hypothetical protein [bacterium]
MKYIRYNICSYYLLYIKNLRLLNLRFFYSTVTLFAKFWGLSISLFRFFATSTANNHKGIKGKKGVNIGCVLGISIISSYISFTVSPDVITHNTSHSLAFISFIFDIVFSLISHFGFITIQGKFCHTRASGPCFNSQVE